MYKYDIYGSCFIILESFSAIMSDFNCLKYLFLNQIPLNFHLIFSGSHLMRIRWM
jgi:hypothetical protein